MIRYGQFEMMDLLLIYVYLVIQIGLLIAIAIDWVGLIQYLHILFTAMFVIVPLFATSPILFAFHMIVTLCTLAARSECDGKCPVNTLEKDEEKIYNESIVDQINFNLVFWSSGIVTIIRWVLCV